MQTAASRCKKRKVGNADGPSAKKAATKKSIGYQYILFFSWCNLFLLYMNIRNVCTVLFKRPVPLVVIAEKNSHNFMMRGAN